jgi:hypothetical protein
MEKKSLERYKELVLYKESDLKLSDTLDQTKELKPNQRKVIFTSPDNEENRNIQRYRGLELNKENRIENRKVNKKNVINKELDLKTKRIKEKLSKSERLKE